MTRVQAWSADDVGAVVLVVAVGVLVEGVLFLAGVGFVAEIAALVELFPGEIAALVEPFPGAIAAVVEPFPPGDVVAAVVETASIKHEFVVINMWSLFSERINSLTLVGVNSYSR